MFVHQPGQADKAKVVKRKFEVRHGTHGTHGTLQVEEGDLLTLLNVYYAFHKSGSSKHWCSSHFLRFKALKR